MPTFKLLTATSYSLGSRNLKPTAIPRWKAQTQNSDGITGMLSMVLWERWYVHYTIQPPRLCWKFAERSEGREEGCGVIVLMTDRNKSWLFEARWCIISSEKTLAAAKRCMYRNVPSQNLQACTVGWSSQHLLLWLFVKFITFWHKCVQRHCKSMHERWRI